MPRGNNRSLLEVGPSASFEQKPFALPPQLTPFVGRKSELSELVKLLADPAIRLVTILGPGGIGKTRLALASADLMKHTFTFGAAFVPLAALNEANEIIPAIADTLNLRFYEGSSPMLQLLSYLQGKQILLVLDNFEHLLEGAEVVHELLLAAPGLKLLITSREKLKLQEEVRFKLRGMSFPKKYVVKNGTQLADASRFEALSLFAQSAQRARPDFQLNEDNLAQVTRICQIVGGNPLGIQLATAWTEIFSAQEIASEIERSLDFLATEMRDLPIRHRSMRAVFDSSWKQLSGDEQRVFAKLAVFRGGFLPPAAEMVAGASQQSLVTLFNKSLLERNRTSGRYLIHELIRHYAAEKLRLASETEKTRAVHCAYYADFMSQRLEDILGKRQFGARDEIAADFDNVRAAWGWAVQQKDYASLEGMAKVIYVYCDLQSRNFDGEQLFQQARKRLSPQPREAPYPTWSRILLAWYDMYSDSYGPLEDLDEITAQAEVSLRTARRHDDKTTMGYCMLLLGSLEAQQGEYFKALNLFKESLLHCPSLEDGYYPFARMGHCYIALGQLEAAQDCFQKLLDRARASGECTAVAWALAQIGEVGLMRGDLESPVKQWQEAGKTFERFGAFYGLVYSSSLLSLAALIQGDLSRARSVAEEVVLLGQRHSYPADLYWAANAVLAWLDLLNGGYKRARIGFEAISSLRSGRAEALLGLTYAAIGQQQWDEARSCLQAVLKPEIKFRAPAFVVLQLPAAAFILHYDGQLDLAADLWELTLNHPSSPEQLLQQWPLVEAFGASIEMNDGLELRRPGKKKVGDTDLQEINSRLRKLFHVSEGVSEQQFKPATASYRQEPLVVEPLSKREMEILLLLKTDLTGPEIARELVISLNTVRFHTKNIYSKLQVNNRIAAVQRAEQLGLLG